MSAENQESHSSSDPLPFREGALSPAEIRWQCRQFRILVIGKANAGKTTILRKVCNAKPDAKPIIYDAKGKKVRRDLADVCHGNLAVPGRTNINLGPCGSCSR
jgi:GTPase SAR1 family protein